ncbi:Septin-2 [Hypsibius exemplaris]|uniref:Septin-2 n=1 Tax=Hypsibius exemplaris TaxID=2072580 RepID=A0A1W0WZT2_HYPEX|nr:Septin-2 [Hypsibius exemplaris]
MDSLSSVYGVFGPKIPQETVSSGSKREVKNTPTSSRSSPESEPVIKRKKMKGFRSRFQRWISGSTNGSNRGSTLSTSSSVTSSTDKYKWTSATLNDLNRGSPGGRASEFSSNRSSSVNLRPALIQSTLTPPSYLSGNRAPAPPSDTDDDDDDDVSEEAESSIVHPVHHRQATPTSEPSELHSSSRKFQLPTTSTDTSALADNRIDAPFASHAPVELGMLAAEKMDVHHGGIRGLHERNVEEFMDARSGADDLVNGNNLVDAEGVKVRTVKLLASQNVGFESLPVQFVNKATKAGFVFNVLVIGETGIGKSTLINSLFNYDFKLPPGDYQHDSVTLDKHAFQLEEGSVRLHLTIIETKGYGDQLNMTDSCQGIVEYIDKQYEAYFQEESQVVRRLSDYKDTRIHVCLFLLAPTGSNVRALDLECMKLLSNKVNIIPVIARGDSLTKKELDSFKRRIMAEIHQHKISIYSFPEDDGQVADLNRKMNADVPFAVVGSSEVHEVAGHKARARVYPWGIVDIENEAHCDFTRFREALLRVNMDHLMQTTNLRHYEVYRDRRMTELGYGENEPQNFMETITRLRQTNEQKYRQKEEETRTSFVNKVREKEAELKERERELHSQFEHRKAEFSDHVLEINTQQSALQKEVEIFHRVKSELVNSQAGTIKGSKKNASTNWTRRAWIKQLRSQESQDPAADETTKVSTDALPAILAQISTTASGQLFWTELVVVAVVVTPEQKESQKELVVLSREQLRLIKLSTTGIQFIAAI